MIQAISKLLQALRDNEKAQTDLTRLYLNGGGAALANVVVPSEPAPETSKA